MHDNTQSQKLIQFWSTYMSAITYSDSVIAVIPSAVACVKFKPHIPSSPIMSWKTDEKHKPNISITSQLLMLLFVMCDCAALVMLMLNVLVSDLGPTADLCIKCTCVSPHLQPLVKPAVATVALAASSSQEPEDDAAAIPLLRHRGHRSVQTHCEDAALDS